MNTISIFAALSIALTYPQGVDIPELQPSDHRAPLPFGSQFIENDGLWQPDLLWVGTVNGHAVGLRNDGFDLLVRESGRVESIGFRLPEVGELIGEAPSGRPFHYFIGSDPDNWTTRVGHEAVSWHLTDGLLRLRSNGALEWDGTQDLRFEILGASLTAATPVALESSLTRLDVPSGLTRESSRSLRLKRSSMLPGQQNPVQTDIELPTGIIEPHEAISWSSMLGGVGYDEPTDMAIDAEDRILVAGATASIDFPVEPGAPQADLAGGFSDAFVVRFTADGSGLDFASYLGASGRDLVSGLDVASDGTIAIALGTTSADFPITTGAFDSTFDPSPAGEGVFNSAIARLTADGGALLYSTYYGNAAFDPVKEDDVIALSDGTVWVGSSAGGPIPAPDAVFGGTNYGSFIVRMRADGSSPLSQFSAPNSGEIARLSDGSIVVAGTATDFSIIQGVPSWSPTWQGGLEAFLARVSSDGKTLLGATYFGGSGGELVTDVAVDAFDNIYVAGETIGLPDFPIDPMLFGQASSGGWAMLASFSPDLSTLRYSTAIASGEPTEDNIVNEVAVDASGVATLIAHSPDGGFAWPFTPGAYFDGAFIGGRIARISPTGAELLYSSWMYSGGNTLLPQGGVMASDGDTVSMTSRVVTSESVPTTPGAFMTSSPEDGFDLDIAVTQLTFDAVRTVPLGGAGSSCLGPVHLGTSRSPDIGADDFGVYCSQAPPSTLGAVVIGVAEPVPLPSGSGELLLDLDASLAVPVLTTETGYAFVTIPIPASVPGGLQLVAQAGFISTPECPAPGLLTLSRAMELTFE